MEHETDADVAVGRLPASEVAQVAGVATGRGHFASR